MINLKAEPFCLSDQDCQWVTQTIACMSDEEKVGQLFFGISSSYGEAYLKELTAKYHLGGCRYNTAPGVMIRKHNEVLQQSSEIPLFIACNTESGGDNACSDGTFIGSGIKIGAIGEKEYVTAQKAISEKGITLVKYKDKEVLPLTTKKYRRIMLVHVKGAESGMTALMKAVGMGGGSPVELLKKKLEEKGFEVFVYENPLDKMKRQAQDGQKTDFNEFFAGKSAIADFTSQMDLVITVCDVTSGRPCFGLSEGGGEIPWYVFEVPVIVIGVESPTMLADIPQARTYINTYDAKETTMDVLVEKLIKGPSAFRGTDPIDSFCGLFDTHL